MLTKFGRIVNAFIQEDRFLPWLNNANYAHIETKNVLGNTVYTTPYYYDGFTRNWLLISTDVNTDYTGNQTGGFALGSGTTPATEDDYTMENQILGLTLSSTISSTSYEYDSENDCIVFYKDATVSNNTGSDVVISEIGLFRTYSSSPTKGASSNLTQQRFMTAHTILDEPVTIANGEAGVIRIKGVYPCSE